MGKLMLNILLSFAQFERENTSEKTRDKMKQRAKLGKWHGGWIPFGYDYNQETKKLIINKQDSNAVRKSYERFNEGEKPSEIINFLNQKGIRTKTRSIKKNGKIKSIGGNRFNEDTIKHILQNPIYKGYVHLDGEEFKGQHQAIVTTKIWDKANKRFKNKIPKKIEFKKDNHVHLLKGIIKCGQGDTFMTPNPSG
jgi:hypothetical protein